MTFKRAVSTGAMPEYECRSRGSSSHLALPPSDPQRDLIIHHLGDPYVDETISIAARNPNIWLALSAWINIYPIMPMEAMHRLGKALLYVGPDRLLWGSEAFIWPNVQGYIELFADLEMPEELMDGYGYPQITREMKKKIFGENFAGLLGINIEQKKAELGLTEEPVPGATS